MYAYIIKFKLDWQQNRAETYNLFKGNLLAWYVYYVFARAWLKELHGVTDIKLQAVLREINGGGDVGGLGAMQITRVLISVLSSAACCGIDASKPLATLMAEYQAEKCKGWPKPFVKDVADKAGYTAANWYGICTKDGTLVRMVESAEDKRKRLVLIFSSYTTAQTVLDKYYPTGKKDLIIKKL